MPAPGSASAATAREVTSYELLLGDADLEAAAIATAVPRLSLVPASPDLAGAEIELSGRPQREFLLRKAVRSRMGDYDQVLIDCPPSLNLLTINALVAADRVLVPLQCEFYALEGLAQLTQTIERVQQALNPRLALHGVLLTMYDRRNNLCDLVAADVRGHFGEKVYDTVIPRNVRVSRGAVARHAGADLRSPLPGVAGLYAARGRDHAARGGGMSEESRERPRLEPDARARQAPVARTRSRGAVRRDRRAAAVRAGRRPPERHPLGADRGDPSLAVPAAPPFRRGGAGGAGAIDPRQGDRAAAARAPGGGRRREEGPSTSWSPASAAGGRRSASGCTRSRSSSAASAIPR